MSVWTDHIFRAKNPVFASVTVGLVSAFIAFRNYQEGRGLYLICRPQRERIKECLSPSTREELSVYDYLTDDEGRNRNQDNLSDVLIYDYVFAFEEDSSAHKRLSFYENALNTHIDVWAGV